MTDLLLNLTFLAVYILALGCCAATVWLVYLAVRVWVVERRRKRVQRELLAELCAAIDRHPAGRRWGGASE